METKYTLTIEQIQTIIENYKLGEYCKNNCYGCCGSDNYHSHCKDCVPKMKKHIEEMTKITLEQVKKEWEAFGWKWTVVNEYIILTFKHGKVYKDILLNNETKSYCAFKNLTLQEHVLLTKTMKALGWN